MDKTTDGMVKKLFIESSSGLFQTSLKKSVFLLFR